MTKFHVTERAVVDAPVERVWEVVSRTDRYAEWVASAIEVTDHHGIAALGGTYAERNRTLGPLRTDSVWTVVEIDPLRRRVDAGVGFAPLKEVTSIFEFEPVRSADGREVTRMTYKVEYVIGLGPLGLLLDRIQQPGMRANMRTSMANLNTLIRSETLSVRG
ncbi:SRPBCC family protein [Streptomyces pseudovenezuelae]|uniref:Ligand-binding SRPBCC domain-containing protein n=1 Tax=Streptomyces pseudovenezuelae TaxID=67350 RepID=A0ABT6LCY3_9ACTN|nr:SRPBCC family protein [Streptomyces pseudovenezuelae]MDH6213476.1 ligand-binding SRPBCC domain-containing protein [Streptomyces pseudovenezuelae]